MFEHLWSKFAHPAAASHKKHASSRERMAFAVMRRLYLGGKNVQAREVPDRLWAMMPADVPKTGAAWRKMLNALLARAQKSN